MPVFSSALALSLMAGSAGLFAGKKLGAKQAGQQTALSASLDSARLASDTAAAAQLAGQKRRKMATAVSGVMGARPRRVDLSAVMRAPSLAAGQSPNFLERRY